MGRRKHRGLRARRIRHKSPARSPQRVRLTNERTAMTLTIQRYSSSDDPIAINMMEYGPSGAGKTQFACSFPTPIVLDSDDGMVGVTVKDAMRIAITD